MHKNTHYNIVQADGNGNRNFVVIAGLRTDSGHRTPGAAVISGELPREEAIALADQLQSAYQEGHVAGLNDLPYAGNPFAMGVDERKAWNAGYEDGRDKLFEQRTAAEVQAQIAADRAAMGLPN